MNFLSKCFSIIYLIIVLLFSNTTTLFSQKTKIGNVDKKLLEMEIYSEDSSASAVIINDYGKNYYDFNAIDGKELLKFRRNVRIKILTKEGLDWANWEIKLFRNKNDKEVLESVKGFTYNLVDGKIEKEKFHNEIYEKDQDTYHYSENFTFSKVKVGSVIDLEYLVSSPFGQYINDWYFQYSIPVMRSEYIFDYPEFYEFSKRVNGYVPLTEVNSSSYSKTVSLRVNYVKDGYTATQQYSMEDFALLFNKEYFLAENVPAFKREKYLSSENNYISKIEFQFSRYVPKFGRTRSFSSTWNDINTYLFDSDDFGGEFRQSRKIYKSLESISQDIREKYDNKYDQMIAAYNFIQSQMSWNNELSIFPKTNLDNAFWNKTGNIGELNLSYLCLLRSLEIESYPVLGRTRKSGFLFSSSPSLYNIDYLMVYALVGDEAYLMDVSDKDIPCTMLPERAINNMYWILDDKKYGMIEIPLRDHYKSVEMITGELGDDALIHGMLQASYSGYSGLEKREEINEFGSKENYIKKKEENWPESNFNSFEITNYDNSYEPLKESIDVDLNNACTVAGDLIYFNPILLNRIEQNPFKLKEREYPVDFIYIRDHSYILNLKIPEGYVVEELPENSKVVLPENSASFTYSINQAGQSIQVISKLKINKTSFVSSEYEYLKQYYNLIIDKHAQQIVFKKI